MSTTHQIARAPDRSGFTPSGLCDDDCGGTIDLASSAGTAVPPTATGETSGDAPDDSCGDTCGCGGDATAADGPPIACTLDANQMGSRIEEWTALLEGKDDLLAGVTARRATDDGVRLELGPNTDVAEIARLAAAEQACCRFFRFALTIDVRGTALEVRVPADALEIVTALFGAPA